MGASFSIVLSSAVSTNFPRVEHYLVELLHGLVPPLPIKGSEGLVVVAAELGRRLAFEFGQGLRVPEDEMVGKLADGMVALAVGPTGLLGSKSFDGDVGGDEPVFVGVRGLELIEKDAAQRGWFLVLLLILCEGEKGQAKKYGSKDPLHGEDSSSPVSIRHPLVDSGGFHAAPAISRKAFDDHGELFSPGQREGSL